MKNTIKLPVVVVIALLFSHLALAQAVFSVTKVAGASPNSFTGINDSGQVIVNTGTSDSYQVSTWNRIIGTDHLEAIGTNSGGAAIDASGDVVGAGDPNNTGNLQAFLWRPAGELQLLGTLGGALSIASGVNASQSVVGFAYTSSNLQHAFYWTQSGGMLDLTPTITNVGGATAMGVNTSDEVAGYYYPNGAMNTVGFTWTQAGGFQSFGPAGTLAFAINDSGTVVGRAPSASGTQHAFSWTQSGGIKDLGTLGGSQSSALSVNKNGWIVGTSLTTAKNGIPHPFLWTPTGGMKDLTLLAALSSSQQPYSMQVNDSGVIAITTNKGGYILIPKTTGVIVSSANPSTLGQSVTFTATLSSIAGPPPDGETVTFLVSGKSYGAAVLHGGVAQLTTSAITVGSHAVVAKYLGDENFLPATYTAITQVVNQ